VWGFIFIFRLKKQLRACLPAGYERDFFARFAGSGYSRRTILPRLPSGPISTMTLLPGIMRIWFILILPLK